ncbi:MAG: imelysin family protein [Octadecabacter sp.]
MKRPLIAATLALSPMAALAAPSIADIVDGHILPRFETLAVTSQALSDVAQQHCDPTSDELRTAYHTAFDAWITASHLRFGPTEVDDRAFALAFWPDSRGATPRALNDLITQEDPIANSADNYVDESIAARGFYAMEFLLYDDALMVAGDPAYHCTLVQTVSADIAATSAAIFKDWNDSYADIIQTPAAFATYRNDEEVLQEMLRAFTAGLEFTKDSRLGRPLGTFDRPRPTRAETWRSGRSADHVMLSLASLRDLATYLAADDADLAQTFETQFDTATSRLAALNDPVFAGVAAPQTRIKVEVVQQAVGTIQTTAQTVLGPTLGVAAGFNSLDGD